VHEEDELLMSELPIACQYLFTNFTLIALQIETKLASSQLSIKPIYLRVLDGVAN